MGWPAFFAAMRSAHAVAWMHETVAGVVAQRFSQYEAASPLGAEQLAAFDVHAALHESSTLSSGPNSEPSIVIATLVASPLGAST
jgi:hypothetical protein